MYRTYRNLYRIRPAITAIGEGQHRIRLPKGFQITLDMFLLTLLLWFPASLLSSIFLKDLIPLPAPLIGFIVAGGISMKLEKIDPSGKNMINFILDFVKYVFRTKRTNGFHNQPKLESYKIQGKIPVGLIEGNRVGSLPATGYEIDDFYLNGNLDVKLDKQGHLTVGYKVKGGKTLPKGHYTIRNNKIFKYKNTPKLN